MPKVKQWYDRPCPPDANEAEWDWYCYRMRFSPEWADLRRIRNQEEQEASDRARVAIGRDSG